MNAHGYVISASVTASREVKPNAIVTYTSVGLLVTVQLLKGNARSLER